MSNAAHTTTRRNFLRTLVASAPVLALAPGRVTAAPRLAPAPDLGFITQELPLRRRYEWARIPPNPDRLRVAQVDRYARITLHHLGMDVTTVTAESEVKRCLDGVLGGHLRRHFGDVGYHFLIDYAGRVWEGRLLSYWGAHVANHNERNIGIVLLGNFEQQRPSRAQLRSMERLVAVVRSHYAIPRGQIYGHIDLGQTLCPGKYLYPRVQRLNQLA